MFGRLLEYFEQCVECRGREHVHLVDDVNALFDNGGAEYGLVTQRADIVDTVVRGGVKLNNVHYGAVLDAEAGGTRIAWIAVHGMFAVDRAGENFSTGCLACAARSDEQVSVTQPTGNYLFFQSLGYVRLAYDVVEGARAPLAIESLIHYKLPRRITKYGSEQDCTPFSE